MQAAHGSLRCLPATTSCPIERWREPGVCLQFLSHLHYFGQPALPGIGGLATCADPHGSPLSAHRHGSCKLLSNLRKSVHLRNIFLYVIDFHGEIRCARLSELRRCSFYYGIFSSPF
jgi:hypothetical protein